MAILTSLILPELPFVSQVRPFHTLNPSIHLHMPFLSICIEFLASLYILLVSLSSVPSSSVYSDFLSLLRSPADFGFRSTFVNHTKVDFSRETIYSAFFNHIFFFNRLQHYCHSQNMAIVRQKSFWSHG